MTEREKKYKLVCEIQKRACELTRAGYGGIRFVPVGYTAQGARMKAQINRGLNNGTEEQ